MKLTATDKLILDSYSHLIEGLSAYLGSAYEIVLHSFEDNDHSIIKIMNGHHSGRSKGAALTEVAAESVREIESYYEERPYKTYFTHSHNGALIKSATTLIKGEKGRTIGFLCVNFYADSPVSDILNLFLSSTNEPLVRMETFGYNSEAAILETLDTVKRRIYADASIHTVNKNKEIIAALNAEGVFNLKDAVATVASNLGISKNTVYLHLRALNGTDG